MVQNQLEDTLVDTLKKLMLSVVSDTDEMELSDDIKQIVKDFVSEVNAVDSENIDKALEQLAEIAHKFKIKVQKENECSTEHN